MIPFATTESSTSGFLTIRGYRDSAASHHLPGAFSKPALLTLPDPSWITDFSRPRGCACPKERWETLLLLAVALSPAPHSLNKVVFFPFIITP